jgi:uncharacterized protein
MEKTMKRAGLVVLVFAAAATLGATAESLPPVPKHHFNDEAGLVPVEAARRLDEKLVHFEEETSTQVVVAIYPELTSPSLEDFTIRTAQAWRIGQKKLDNGLVFFIFAKDHRMRLEVGYGLEAAMPDIRAKEILDGIVRPKFRENDFAGGIEAGLDAIFAATKGEYTGTGKPAAAAPVDTSFSYFLFHVVPKAPIAAWELWRDGGRDVRIFMAIVAAVVGPLFFFWLVSFVRGIRDSARRHGTYSGGGFSLGNVDWGDLAIGAAKVGGEVVLAAAGGAFGGGGASGDW